MRYEVVDLGKVEREQPEQTARPLAADVVVKARAARCQVIDAGGQVVPAVRERAPERTQAGARISTPAAWAMRRGGVQADLALPAPAIAVNGSDACQRWFSLVEPLPAPQAAAFLDALRRR